MTWPGWVFVGLAGGFVVLALYGKYRTIREEFEEAREREAERQAGLGPRTEPGSQS
jgi:hypothetical protein